MQLPSCSRGATTEKLLSVGALWRGPLTCFFDTAFFNISLRLAAEVPLPRIFFALVLSGGGHCRVFFYTVFFNISMGFADFWCLFRQGGCLWSLTGCPLTPEAAWASFLDAFWSDLEVLLGALGGHFWSLFGACFAVCFFERRRGGVLSGFGSIPGLFWCLLWGRAEKCH